MAFPDIQTPVRSGAEHDNRITLRLNKAGTEAENPIIASGRDLLDANSDSNGFALKMTFGLSHPLETIVGASAISYDESGLALGAVDLGSFWSVAGAVATATIIMGQDIPVYGSPSRVVVAVSTSSSRPIKAQFWLAGMPLSAILIDGKQSSVGSPVQVLMPSIDGIQEAKFSVQILSSLNDELGRQHGSESIAKKSAISKPYGGALTVIAYRGGIVPVTEELDCRDLVSIEHVPTVEDEIVQYRFDFRSKRNGGNPVSAFAYIKFSVCDVLGGGSSSSIASSSSMTPASNPDVPKIVSIFDNDQGTIESDGGGNFVRVKLEDSGELANGSNPAQVDLEFFAYDSSYYDSAGVNLGVVPNASTQTESIASVDGQTFKIYLDPAIEDSDLVFIKSSSVVGVGSGISCHKSIVSIGAPTVPVISSATFDFANDLATFNLDDLGFPGETVTAHAFPLMGGLEDASPQTILQAMVEFEEVDSFDYSTVGNAKVFSVNFSSIDVVVLWFSNSFGSTEPTILKRASTDSMRVKSKPVASSFAMSTQSSTRDSVTFNLDSTGGNVGSLVLNYLIHEAILGAETPQMPTSQDVGKVSVSSSVGSKTIELQDSDQDIMGYYSFWLTGEQGFSDVASVNNLVGTSTLGGG